MQQQPSSSSYQRRRHSCAAVVVPIFAGDVHQEPNVLFSTFPEVALEAYLSLASKTIHYPSYQVMATVLQSRFPNHTEEVLELLPSLMTVFTKNHTNLVGATQRRGRASKLCCCCSRWWRRKKKGGSMK